MHSLTDLVDICKRYSNKSHVSKSAHVCLVYDPFLDKVISIGINRYTKRGKVISPDDDVNRHDTYVCNKYPYNITEEFSISNVDRKLLIRRNNMTIHSEIVALIKCLKYPHLSRCQMIVVRFDQSGKLANSCPCSNCANFIVKKGIKTIYFSV